MEDIQLMEYLSSKIQDFLLIGNIDAFKGKEKQTEIIFKLLKDYYGKLELLKILRNYLLGYEIGIIEKQANSSGMVAIFDYKTRKLIIEGSNIGLPYDKEYEIIETESYKTAKKLVQLL